MEFLLARQPIYDRKVDVMGYELLFRHNPGGAGDVLEGTDASAAVSVHALLDVGLDRLVGKELAFVNATAAFLTEGHYLSLPAERVVLEVLEDVEPTAQLLDTVRDAVSRGYTIALDDFVYRKELTPLIDLAHIIKVDIRAIPHTEYSSYPARLSRPGLRMLAEKVETHEEFEACSAAGFDLFQGYFLFKPRLITGRHVAADRVGLLYLLSRLDDPNIEVAEVERLISSTPLLGYKLLVYANSALTGAARRVDSIRHAIVVLGLDRVRSSIRLLLMSGLNGKPRDLASLSLVRARTLQMLAQVSGEKDDGKFLTVGLLSVIDAMMDASMQELLDAVSLPTEVRDALLQETGPAGRALRICRCCETGDWESARDTGFDPAVVQQCYFQALGWAEEMGRMLEGGVSTPETSRT